MLRFFTDIRFFNYVILVLYACNSLRWLVAGKWVDALYWLSAFGITATVTFGYKH